MTDLSLTCEHGGTHEHYLFDKDEAREAIARRLRGEA